MMAIKDENTHNSGAADDDALAAIADAFDETSSFGNTRRVAKTEQRQTDHTYHDWARHPINGQEGSSKKGANNFVSDLDFLVMI
eukprot:scaffold24027_cov86-Cyclotella_meneghiniana.AAC.4